MKKIIALGLCVLMMLTAFAGCGGKKQESVIGSWTGQVDIAGTIRFDFIEDGDLAIYMRLRDLNCGMTYTFDKRGSYSVVVDRDSTNQLFSDLRQQLVACYTAYLKDKRDEGVVDMPLNEVNASAEESAGKVYEAIAIEDHLSSLEAEGKYQVKGNKLYLSADRDSSIEKKSYVTFDVTQQTLSLVEGFGAAESALYPATFSRVQ